MEIPTVDVRRLGKEDPPRPQELPGSAERVNGIRHMFDDVPHPDEVERLRLQHRARQVSLLDLEPEAPCMYRRLAVELDAVQLPASPLGHRLQPAPASAPHVEDAPSRPDHLLDTARVQP